MGRYWLFLFSFFFLLHLGVFTTIAVIERALNHLHHLRVYFCHRELPLHNKLHFRLHAYNIPRTLSRHFLLPSPTRRILGSVDSVFLALQIRSKRPKFLTRGNLL